MHVSRQEHDSLGDVLRIVYDIYIYWDTSQSTVIILIYRFINQHDMESFDWK